MVAWENEVRAGGGTARPRQARWSPASSHGDRLGSLAGLRPQRRRGGRLTRRGRLRPSPAGWDRELLSWHPVRPVLPRQGLRAAPRAGVLTLEGSRRSHRCRQGPSCTWSPGSVLQPGRVEGHLPRPGASRTPPGAVVLQGLAGPRGGQTAPGKWAEDRHSSTPAKRGGPAPPPVVPPFCRWLRDFTAEHSRATAVKGGLEGHRRGRGTHVFLPNPSRAHVVFTESADAVGPRLPIPLLRVSEPRAPGSQRSSPGFAPSPESRRCADPVCGGDAGHQRPRADSRRGRARPAAARTSGHSRAQRLPDALLPHSANGTTGA